MIFHTHFLKDWNYYEEKLHVKSASFSTDNSWTSVMPKYLDKAFTDFA